VSRQNWIRSAFITVVGGLVVAWIGVQFGPKTALIAVVVGVVFWIVFEALIRLRGVRVRIVLPSRREDDEANDYGAQLAALMMMPLNEAPVVRARVAMLFAPFQLSAAERSVLVRWATFALSGSDLDYDVQPVPGFEGRWRVRCHINQSPQPLDGAIEGAEAHRIVDAHKAMVARLLEERRPARGPARPK
jgi:hypothetical protein